MRQLVNTIFFTNNCASFHLWWNENLVKHQKVSKYYENDCGWDLWRIPTGEFVFSKVAGLEPASWLKNECFRRCFQRFCLDFRNKRFLNKPFILFSRTALEWLFPFVFFFLIVVNIVVANIIKLYTVLLLLLMKEKIQKKKIINSKKPLIIFAKKLHRRCSTGFQKHLW